MRTYYLFKVNKYFAYIYKMFPLRMYKIVEELYYSKDYNLVQSYRYYKKFANYYNKSIINNYIYDMNKINNNYYRDNSTHIINNGKYNKLIVNSSCLILKTDDIYSVFLNDLNHVLDNVFVCDFKNRDYFWLESLNKDRQNNLSLV
ncbi:MAG: sporulation inhibitor of replication protein SirA [Bacilli bacterium]|nr:sporulation inhibitor of replication protein SirA [Bacilli bacterium]